MLKQVIFLHPDLGIGGAERLVVDAAVAMHQSGYKVRMITNYHDRSHCFEETKGADVNVVVVGNWFPRSIFGRFTALCAYIRMLIAAVYLICTCEKKSDLVFVDQISAPLPVLYFFGFRTLFYCHFPDQLLTDRKTCLKRLYRYPVDCLEEYCTGYADKIVVNSHFTANVVRKTFPTLSHLELEVLYPVSNAVSLRLPAAVIDPEDPLGLSGSRRLSRKALPSGLLPNSARFVFVSINRYERKKNLRLALFALSHLFVHWKELVDAEKSNHAQPQDVHLIVAGGYDTRVIENVDYHEELVLLAKELKISERVSFVRSCSSEIKALLIASSDAVLYTPEGEHFGIVPIEAMFMSRPVVALDSGGPRETVMDGSTGYLCPVDSTARLPAIFATCMARFINDPSLVLRMGQLAHRRVVEKFSFEAFRQHLGDVISHMCGTEI
ncbi:hypothetical protein P879_09530 [Paragonimus westermani]|uniref:Alpha-1,3/1,6-mannosyltransferase ALG2 n=1 Tax=Paragonimus westermani TaxID=34504 RepID=A0A8T0DCR6_9TREM|nr:hypothetical protein P879_09530 [Paragonimus westermani]